MSECRRITDPAPTPFAVRHAERRTCIQMLADGWIDCVSDLCPSCTQLFMAALDSIGEPLKWSPGFRERAGVESPRGLSETEKDEREAELNRGGERR